MAPVEAGLIAGRSPRYVQLATAAVPDGPDVVKKWHDLGVEQAERLGVEPVIVAVADRRDADDPGLAALVAGAGLIYLSGGHPAYLADVLRGSRVWAAIAEAWQSGSALAGCSAGAMALASWVPNWRAPEVGWTEGLGLLPHLRVIPHFDRFWARMDGSSGRFSRADEPGVTVVGIDEDTAVVGGPEQWTVQGRQSAWIVAPDGSRTRFPVGAVVQTT